jgi:hypothetical protein
VDWIELTIDRDDRRMPVNVLKFQRKNNLRSPKLFDLLSVWLVGF